MKQAQIDRPNRASVLPQLRTEPSGPLRIKSADFAITLKQYTLEDANAIFALIDGSREHLSQFGDPTSRNYPTLESVEKSIAKPYNADSLRFGIWDDKDALAGYITLLPDSDNARRGEIGYYLGKDFLRRGYMTKSLETLTEYAFYGLNYKTLYASVAEENIASSNVLSKLGYVNFGKRFPGSSSSVLSSLNIYIRTKPYNY